jgi:hypothetical protein
MSTFPHRPRLGRLVDGLAIALFLFIFVGLALYHYRRLDSDPEATKELA